MGKRRGRAPIETYEVRQLTFNAIVRGRRATLLDRDGKRITEVSLAQMEGLEAPGVSARWLWMAVVEIKLWRLGQQLWKARQDPWQQKAISLASTVRMRAPHLRPRLGLKPGRKRALVRDNWAAAAKAMSAYAHQSGGRLVRDPWKLWATSKASQAKVRIQQEQADGQN